MIDEADSARATVRIRLGIAYEGTHFSGWAAQPQLRTVQGVLEGALRVLYRDLSPGPLLTVAGRTDAGVHALGQVAHLDLPETTWLGTARGREFDPSQALRRRLGGILGADGDVQLTAAARAPAGFDARFSALWRSYRYRLADQETEPDPLLRHVTARIPRRLDLVAMNEAAETLIGLHDFAGFCKPRAHATTIRTLQEFRWHRDQAGVLVAHVRADAFCHSMVRSLVGMCAAVGSGRLPLSGVPDLLQLGERSNAFPVLAAHGLTLMQVGYPGEGELAERAERTRARRTTTAPESVGTAAVAPGREAT